MHTWKVAEGALILNVRLCKQYLTDKCWADAILKISCLKRATLSIYVFINRWSVGVRFFLKIKSDVKSAQGLIFPMTHKGSLKWGALGLTFSLCLVLSQGACVIITVISVRADETLNLRNLLLMRVRKQEQVASLDLSIASLCLPLSLDTPLHFLLASCHFLPSWTDEAVAFQ